MTIRRVKQYIPINTYLKVLIVAPSSAIGSWVAELELEQENTSAIALLIGLKAVRRKLLEREFEAPHRSWCIINPEGYIALPEISEYDWDCVIVDEGHFLSNPKTRVFKFFFKNFRDCPHRWILTGMPNPESILQFWAQFAFLDGRGFEYKNFWDFRAQLFRCQGFDWIPKPGVAAAITEEVGRRAFIMRRKDVGVEPNKIFTTRLLTLPENLQKLYDKAEEDFDLDGKLTIWATKKYIWLRRLCGGFIDDKQVWNAKVSEIVSLMQGELRGEKVVVWFFFNSEIPPVYQALKKIGIQSVSITGEQPIPIRDTIRKAWISGKHQVLLLQQKIAATGMDLSASDTAIYYSENPSLITSAQTQDRIVSLSKSTSLLYIYLVCQDTVDSDVNTLLKEKSWRSDMDLSRALKDMLHLRTQRRLGVQV